MLAVIITSNFLVPTVEADTKSSTYEVNINNGAPTMSNINCCFGDTQEALSTCGGATTAYTMTSGKNYDVNCTFKVSDPNGYIDMSDGWVNMTWHRTSVAWNSAKSNDTLYINASCRNLTATASGNDIDYVCYIRDLKYWANSGAWYVQINVSDGDLIGDINPVSYTINSVPAIWQSPSINFGTMNLGDTGSTGPTGNTDQSSTTNNTGNTRIYITAQASAENLSCTIGNIPAWNVTYHPSQIAYASSCGRLTTADAWDTDCTNVTVYDCAGSCTTYSMNNSFWGIGIPSSGVAGSCSLSVSITAAVFT
ncbi:MAG: hypothetical protein V1875_01655 [Candidatus Altiarchaeota archaeon]